MLDLKIITTNTEEVKAKLASRGFDTTIIDRIAELGVQRSNEMTQLQQLEAKRNTLSKSIGKIKAQGGDIQEVMNEVAEIKSKIESVKGDEAKVNEDIRELLLGVPNIPNDNTPVGADEDQNIVITEHANLGRGLVTGVKSHYDIATELGIVDFERAVKMSGARFWAYKGKGARLVRALGSFMIDTHVSKGYLEIVPPVLVNSKTMQGTGQLPKFADDLFKIEGQDKWLIPTAEVPLTNFYSNEIINLDKPVLLTAYTPCFRAEAGSGGRDMKGLIRAHQFNKVEIVKLVKDEDLKAEYQKTVQDAKAILDLLELPYRELQLCTGDIGFSAEETIDLEVWLPSEGKYREISSISSFGNYQGRRASIRYKDANGKTQSANTINGSGLAIDRTIAAILENYQNEDGTITIPRALIPYMRTGTIRK